jgi:hypothetical protein
MLSESPEKRELLRDGTTLAPLSMDGTARYLWNPSQGNDHLTNDPKQSLVERYKTALLAGLPAGLGLVYDTQC